jgi:hypothetical protein
MANGETSAEEWLPFIGRALALLCLHAADMRSDTVLEQADFIMALGLSRAEAARVLASSAESLRVLAAQRAKKDAAKQKGTKTSTEYRTKKR